jgi:hypothetical protein
MARFGGAEPLSTPIAVEAVANCRRSGCQPRQKSIPAKAGVMSSIIRHRNRVIVISLRSRIGSVGRIDPPGRRDTLDRSDRRCASPGEAVHSNCKEIGHLTG